VVEMQRLFYICEPELDWSDMWPIHTKKLVSLRVGSRVDSSCAIGATSVGTGETTQPVGSRLGDQQCIVTQLLSGGFQKAKKKFTTSINCFIISFDVGSINQGRNHSKKVKILELI